ncbi:capsular associated protein [Astrocystis sublimbata]|nr:capsular associated protein [Astrocystis sublimbata]
MNARQRFAMHGAYLHSSLYHKLKYLFAAAFATLLLYSVLSNQYNHKPDIAIPFPSTHTEDFPYSTREHPIDGLIKDAQVQFERQLAKRSTTLEHAASRYRERRGRHPPPGFDTWFQAAQDSDAIVVEDFFDRIYDDIRPFWAFDPKYLRRLIREESHYIRVRDGKAWFVSDHLELRQPWVQRWTELVQEMMPHLPDLDMILNVMDETRVLVPWEEMAKHVAEEQRQRNIFPNSEAVTEYTKYDDEKHDNDEQHDDEKKRSDDKLPDKIQWIKGEANQYWDHYRVTCPPDTPGRDTPSLKTIARPPAIPTHPMSYATEGFIKNFTAAKDPCLQPHIRGMHGTFIESISMSTTHSLIPMFSGSKLPGNNEILIPAGMILDSYDLFSGGETHGGNWTQKKDELIWRGVASGGRNKDDTWWGFHRHRFVQMMNGTTLSLLNAGEDVAPSFNLSDTQVAHSGRGLGKWLSSFSDVAFTNLECFPHREDNTCWYVDPYMAAKEKIHMKEQYEYKYLPDVDGNSYSGRFRAFMRSTSLVLKATIYTEWHDDRLVPWVHFAPFDNTFYDIYAVLDYFLNGHDSEAARIAETGRNWAEKVMRREDMRLYVWRLLLEYARIMDPSRDRLGFVGDLKHTK